MSDHTEAWARWNELHRLRTQNPYDVAAQFLRKAGYIVERPETLSLPVNVACSGSFTEKDGWRVTLHVRATIGDRKAGMDYSIDARNSDMPVQAFTGAITRKFERMIMAELEPQIELGCRRELDRAREGVE